MLVNSYIIRPHAALLAAAAPPAVLADAAATAVLAPAALPPMLADAAAAALLAGVLRHRAVDFYRATY